MKKGLIVIFGKNDVHMTNADIFKSFFNQKIKICFVNNGNHDKVFNLLTELSESPSSDFSILNLRKEKASIFAVKAGVRFLSNKENVQLIIHTEPKNISSPKLIDRILTFFNEDLSTKKNERVLLRSVYSVHEILNHIE
ncbi:MAG: hypothetical protein WAO74_13785 [Polaribacter sp.]|uniref:hypothetical protein n=1 Tax=Polaribacter sp. TaxID=1920175 RepID=UPI003BAE55E6